MDEKVRLAGIIALVALVMLGAAAAIGDANRILAIMLVTGWGFVSGVMLYRLHRLRGTPGVRLVLWMWLSFSFCLATVPFYHLPA